MTNAEFTRRRFLEDAGATTSFFAAGLTMGQTQETNGASTEVPSCLDYSRSFICGTSALNSVRFWIESRTSIVNAATNQTSVFYQCASCKSENTFGEKDLFLADNYDFLPIFGDDHWLIFRRYARLNSERYREVIASPNAWGNPRLVTSNGRNARKLDTWKSIRDAAATSVPLVLQTELTNSEKSLRATIECPVKTMNISLEKEMYQVDTGPIAFPDLMNVTDPMIDCLRLAYVAFNQDDFADFVIEQPTPIVESEAEVCKTHHYSNPISLRAANTILTHD